MSLFHEIIAKVRDCFVLQIRRAEHSVYALACTDLFMTHGERKYSTHIRNSIVVALNSKSY